MTRPPPKVITHVVATVPKGTREATVISVSATDDAWGVDLWNAPLFPDTSIGPRRCGLRLRPEQLRDVAAALISVADFQGAQARETATPEQLAALVDEAAVHNRTIVAAVASNAAVFLKALPNREPFRVFVGKPSILAVLDADGFGPAAFDYTCVKAALRIAHLIVLTVGARHTAHYHAVGSSAFEGRSSVVIETTGDQAEYWMAMLAVEVPDVPVLMTEDGGESAPVRVLQ